MIEKIPLNQLKPNPKNPRTISEAKFEKLKKSIVDFPEMLELRPLIVDETMTVLGGNMRLKALLALGITETSIIRASTLTEEQKKEFLIKDNIAFGEFDFDYLANDFDPIKLDDWGLEIPDFKKEKKGKKRKKYYYL